MLKKLYKLSPIEIILLVAALYFGLTLVVMSKVPDRYPQLQDLSDRLFAFIHPGSRWDPAGSRPVNLDFTGYDGQFFYDLALNPFQPATNLDNPPYRTGRLLYPLVTKLVSLGQPALVPLMLLVVNFGAILTTTYIYARILVRSGRQPFWALGYALWPGTLCAYLYDLSEPLCFLFITCAFWLQISKPEAYWRIGGLLLLASLSKELGLLFGAGWLLYCLTRKNIRGLLKILLVLFGPYTGWQVLLYLKFGNTGLSAGQPFNLGPFEGFLRGIFSQPALVEGSVIFLATVVPISWISWRCLKAGSIKLLSQDNPYHALIFYLLLPQVAFLLFLPTASYLHLVDHARNATGFIFVLYLLPPVIFGRIQTYQWLLSLILSGMVAGYYIIKLEAFL